MAGGYQVGKSERKWVEGVLCDAGNVNVLFLDVSVNYTSLFTCENVLSFLFTICVIFCMFYFNTKV